MLRNIFLFILLGTVLLKPMFFLANVVYYELNVESIVKQYCVNKDKPQLRCNGKCHLAKKLAVANQDSSDKLYKNVSVLVMEPVFFQRISLPIIKTIDKPFVRNCYYWNNQYQYLKEYSFFQPPACL